MAAAYYSLHGNAPWRTNCDDAFLLGCRKLDDFLMNKKRTRMPVGGMRSWCILTQERREADDILAIDYLPANPIRKWRLPIWAAEWRSVMNKQLVHIAYSRDKEWDHLKWVPKLKAEFYTAWSEFLDAIEDHEYRQEFDSQIDARQVKPGFQNIVLKER